MTKLTDFRLLSFDVYGTLIDYETGILNGLTALVERLDLSREQILSIYHELEKTQQSKTPDMPYSQLTTEVYSQFATKFGQPTPNIKDAEQFGQSVGKWPAFPDTVDALKRLSKYYKLVVLSNVDRESFNSSNAGPLEGFKFDKIITAQDVGTYKPDHQNFEYMLDVVEKEFGVKKNEVLQTAQSQFHDHHPAKELGIKSVWIERRGTMGNRSNAIFNWKFTTLGEMADAVESEFNGRV